MKSLIITLFLLISPQVFAASTPEYDSAYFENMLESMNEREMEIALRRVRNINFPNPYMRDHFAATYKYYAFQVSSIKALNKSMSGMMTNYINQLPDPPPNYNDKTARQFICAWMDMSLGLLYETYEIHEKFDNDFTASIVRKFPYIEKGKKWLDRIGEHVRQYRETFDCRYRSRTYQRQLSSCIENSSMSCMNNCNSRGNHPGWCQQQCYQGQVFMTALINCAGVGQ